MNWVKEHAEVVPLLENFHLSLEMTNEVLAWMEAHGNDPQKAALWFLKNNTDFWHSWVDDSKEATEKVNQALEKEKLP